MLISVAAMVPIAAAYHIHQTVTTVQSPRTKATQPNIRQKSRLDEPNDCEIIINGTNATSRPIPLTRNQPRLNSTVLKTASVIFRPVLKRAEFYAKIRFLVWILGGRQNKKRVVAVEKTKATRKIVSL